MNKLQPLFGSILDESKHLSRIKHWIHVFTLLIAIVSIYLEGKYLFVACLLIGVSEIIAWAIRYASNTRKELGQEILRANMLKEAFGKQSGLSIAYLTARIPKSARKNAEKHANDDYYTAPDDGKGKNRLSFILQESCFWSQHLYAKCGMAGLISAAIFIFAILFVAISYSVYAPNDQLYSAPRIFILLVAMVPLWDQIEDVIVWFNAAGKLKEIDHRIESVDCTDDSEMFALFADYNVVTSKASLIPQKVYEGEKEILNTLWKERVGVT